MANIAGLITSLFACRAMVVCRTVLTNVVAAVTAMPANNARGAVTAFLLGRSIAETKTTGVKRAKHAVRVDAAFGRGNKPVEMAVSVAPMHIATQMAAARHYPP